MIAIIKLVGKGLLYLFLIPIGIIFFTLYGIYLLFIWIFNLFKLFFNFLRGKSKPLMLKEDELALNVLEKSRDFSNEEKNNQEIIVNLNVNKLNGEPINLENIAKNYIDYSDIETIDYSKKEEN